MLPTSSMKTLGLGVVLDIMLKWPWLSVSGQAGWSSF